ncbi:MAG: isoprenylcysteine carboxylmethyltransferase family protein [Alphaproteobacteria bacterium]|nr:isoprenylcysteine carboxylmethyltransferase family protein [Alphaproteobacteria bacterium]
MIWRFLPLAGLSLLFLIAVVWRAWLQRRRHGVWGIMLFRSGGPGQWLRDGVLVLAGGLLGYQAVMAAFWPRSVALLAGLHESPWPWILPPAGALVMVTGLALLVAAQIGLGAAWRIGIDEDARPGLVTSGLYRYCRNPIFLGLLLIVAGYAALLPSWLSLILLVGFYVGVRLQIATEEAWLARIYGAAYRDYARRVGRLVPGLGKSR